MPIDLEELVDLFYSLSLTRTLPDDLFKVLWGFWEKGWWRGYFSHATESFILIHLTSEKQRWLRAAYLREPCHRTWAQGEKRQYLTPTSKNKIFWFHASLCFFLQHLDTPHPILGLDSPTTKDMVTKSTGLVWVHSSRGLFAAKNLKMPRFYAQRRNGSNTKRDVTNWMWRTTGEKVCEGLISLFGVSIWRWICNVRDRWNIGVSILKKI